MAVGEGEREALRAVYKQLYVVDLKALLASRYQKTDGRKAALCERLVDTAVSING